MASRTADLTVMPAAIDLSRRMILRIDIESAGHSADEIERRITIPVENTLATEPGVRLVRSHSTDGRSSTTVEFEANVDRDGLAEVLRNGVANLRPEFPASTSDPAFSWTE